MMPDSVAQPVAGIERILIVKLADLGDAVLATPAIGAVRTAYPDARLDVLTTPIGAEVLAMCPAIDRLITFPKSLFDRPAGMLKPTNASVLFQLGWRLRRGRYDALVLLHHLTTAFGATKFQLLARVSGAVVVAGLDNGRGTFLTHRTVDYGFGVRSEWEYGLEVARAIGGQAANDPNLMVPETARIRAETLLKSHDVEKPYVVIHPSVGGYSPARCWPVERFAEVARTLVEPGQRSVVVVGTAEERVAARPLLNVPGAIDLMGETSIASLASVLSMSSLVVGADSGICHLGAAIGAPTISIFGPSNHRAWSPLGVPAAGVESPAPNSRNIILRSNIPCSPCFYAGYDLGRPEGCELRTCLTDVTADHIVDVAKRQLAVVETSTQHGVADPPNRSATRDSTGRLTQERPMTGGRSKQSISLRHNQQPTCKPDDQAVATNLSYVLHEPSTSAQVSEYLQRIDVLRSQVATAVERLRRLSDHEFANQLVIDPLQAALLKDLAERADPLLVISLQLGAWQLIGRSLNVVASGATGRSLPVVLFDQVATTPDSPNPTTWFRAASLIAPPPAEIGVARCVFATAIVRPDMESVLLDVRQIVLPAASDAPWWSADIADAAASAVRSSVTQWWCREQLWRCPAEAALSEFQPS